LKTKQLFCTGLFSGPTQTASFYIRRCTRTGAPFAGEHKGIAFAFLADSGGLSRAYFSGGVGKNGCCRVDNNHGHGIGVLVLPSKTELSISLRF